MSPTPPGTHRHKGQHHLKDVVVVEGVLVADEALGGGDGEPHVHDLKPAHRIVGGPRPGDVIVAEERQHLVSVAGVNDWLTYVLSGWIIRFCEPLPQGTSHLQVRCEDLDFGEDPRAGPAKLPVPGEDEDDHDAKEGHRHRQHGLGLRIGLAGQALARELEVIGITDGTQRAMVACMQAVYTLAAGAALHGAC